MIITRTPLRISFVGGGSDFPDFYNKYPGKVISTTINKYVYVVIHPAPLQDKIMIRYSTIEIVDKVDQIKNDRVREVLKYFGINEPIEIGVYSDLPVGTGLGGSSAFTVGLIKGISKLKKFNLCNEDIAEIACEIEINILKEPIGKQDQYACAIGGLNQYNFTEHIWYREKDNIDLENNLHLFYTGITRNSKDILKKQKYNIPQKIQILKKMVKLVNDFYGTDYKRLGRILDESWKFKKTLAPDITNPTIDKLYNKGLKAGAWGGKLLGAGGGGCLLFIAPLYKKQALKNALGLKEIPFEFTDKGVEVIYD